MSMKGLAPLSADCIPDDQESANAAHGDAQKAIEDGDVALLKDQLAPMGRFQTIASVMGGEVIVSMWHDPKNEGNWHQCKRTGLLLPHGALPKMVRLLEHFGYGPDGASADEN